MTTNVGGGLSQIGAAARGHGGGAGANKSQKNASPVGARSQMSGYRQVGNANAAEKEFLNADKAIVNLMKEHNKLKKRLELIQ